jgi:hypothetical protein
MVGWETSSIFWDITPCGLVVRVSGYRSRGPGFDSRRFQIFWHAAGLERGPLSLVTTTEELLERKSRGSGFKKNEINDHGNPLRWPRDTFYPQKLALTSPTSGCRSVGIDRSRTKATEFSLSPLKVSENMLLPSSGSKNNPSKILAWSRTTWRYIPEEAILDNHRCRNINSYIG